MAEESRKPEGVGPWLRRLRDLAQGWVDVPTYTAPLPQADREVIRSSFPDLAAKLTSDGRLPAGHATAQTPSYVDLVFSFGLARLGESGAARELLDRAQGVLGLQDEAHRSLLTAYKYRITQALEGKPH